MIVMAYPGCGKTTMVNEMRSNGMAPGVIDLESSCFRYRENLGRPDRWWELYVNVAVDLSNQGPFGNYVFVSSHAEVQNELLRVAQGTILIHPARWMKDIWVQRLTRRAEDDPSPKNQMALARVTNCWDEDMDSMERSPFGRLVIGYDQEFVRDVIGDYVFRDRKLQYAEKGPV